MSAPIAPYISESIYKNLTGELSVHLSDYPRGDRDLLDIKLEEKMELVKNLVTLGRASRETVKIKVRQPIQKVLIDGKYENIISDIVDLIKEELNVKEIVFAKNLSEYMNFSLKPNFKVVGPMFGSKIKSFGNLLLTLDPSSVVEKLENGESITLNIEGEDFAINKDHVLITITAKEGFNVSMENNIFVILDTHLTPELINEGFAREFISKVQQMRKNSNFEMMDNIKIYYNSDEVINSAIKVHEDYIKRETLALSIEIVNDNSFEKHELNDHEAFIKVERVK